MSRIVAALAATVVAATPVAAQRPPTSDWKRGAVCYEIFVRSFRDSDGDGVGDLNGVTERLDYVRDLGARCIWLMPIAESPSYHGYDVADYYTVDREYGTRADFERLVAEAHRRDIRVLVDLVLNHASSEHPYFRAALADTASPYRDFFVWSRADPGTKGPWGQTVWHRSPVRDEWYYGIFWHGMPDLNYAKPAAREEAKKIATFWLTEMGADGFRLDAVPYLVEENGRVNGAPGTHAFLRDWSAHVRRVAPHAFTVGEVWDSVSAVLPYYPDQLDAHFTFALSEALLTAVRTGTSRGMLDDWMRMQAAVQPAWRWAPFLRNHDQTRTLTALGGDVRKARLAATLLLTLPGFPFVYYGEEIGMTGDKPDEHLRTPMQWRAEPGAGFTTGTPWAAPQPDWRTTHVAAQERDPSSLLHHYRRLIRLRASHAALAGGALVPLAASHHAVAAFVRRDGDRVALVVANLGAAPLAGVTLSASAGALPGGRWAPRPLVDASAAAPLSVGADGRVDGYVPLPTLAPMRAHVYDLVRPR